MKTTDTPDLDRAREAAIKEFPWLNRRGIDHVVRFTLEQRAEAVAGMVPHSVMVSQIDAAVGAEREAIATFVGKHWGCDQIAAAIRARGEVKHD